MKILLLLPLLLGFSVPAIAHNEFNGGEPNSEVGESSDMEGVCVPELELENKNKNNCGEM